MRSHYLDDLAPKPGTWVICKADLLGEGFKPGNPYLVASDGSLYNDKGERIINSSARWRLADAA